MGINDAQNSGNGDSRWKAAAAVIGAVAALIGARNAPARHHPKARPPAESYADRRREARSANRAGSY